jgi:hypothetical protein
VIGSNQPPSSAPWYRRGASIPGSGLRALQRVRVGTTLAVVVCGIAAGVVTGEEPALRLRAAVIGAAADTALTIELLRWSTDDERAPLVAALSAPPPPPPPAAAAASAGGRAGRGARGGRGGRGNAPPATPAERLAGAVKAAPTVGFIWGDGPTGYSIKYAWRSVGPDGQRIVLVTDRRVGAHSTSWPPAPSASSSDGVEFTVIEIRVGATGAGEGKASTTPAVAADPAAKTLALDDYDTAPVLFKVTR